MDTQAKVYTGPERRVSQVEHGVPERRTQGFIYPPGPTHLKTITKDGPNRRVEKTKTPVSDHPSVSDVKLSEKEKSDRREGQSDAENDSDDRSEVGKTRE